MKTVNNTPTNVPPIFPLQWYNDTVCCIVLYKFAILIGLPLYWSTSRLLLCIDCARCTKIPTLRQHISARLTILLCMKLQHQMNNERGLDVQTTRLRIRCIGFSITYHINYHETNAITSLQHINVRLLLYFYVFSSFILFGLLFVEVKCFQTTALLWKRRFFFLFLPKIHILRFMKIKPIRTWCPLTNARIHQTHIKRNRIQLYTHYKLLWILFCCL